MLFVASLLLSAAFVSAEPLCEKNLHALPKEKQAELQAKKTQDGVTLEKMLKSGVEQRDSSIGCYAGDAESYSLFAPMFEGVIADYHHVPASFTQTKDFDVSALPAFAPGVAKNVASTRVRVARSLSNYPFESSMTRKQRQALEKEVLDTIAAVFKGTEFEGTYYSATKITPEQKDDLIKRHLMFKDSDKDPYLVSAGISSDWPVARGSYVSKDQRFQIWINEEDHMRIMYLEDGSDLKHVASQLFRALDLLNTRLKFARSDRYGYLNSCPTNIGTAMRVSVHMKIPKTSEDELKKLCRPNGLAVRGTGGEHTAILDDTYDISYRKRLGGSEKELATDFVNKVNALFAPQGDYAEESAQDTL
jgi:creatine kinase/arginine kinase